MSSINFAPNFTEEEFLRSETAARMGVSNKWEKDEHRENAKRVSHELQKVRNQFGRLRITSGYRSRRVNKAVGGVSDSLHTQGLAADIFPLDYAIEDVYRWCLTHWPGGVGINRKKQFIHLDLGRKRVITY